MCVKTITIFLSCARNKFSSILIQKKNVQKHNTYKQAVEKELHNKKKYCFHLNQLSFFVIYNKLHYIKKSIT